MANRDRKETQEIARTGGVPSRERHGSGDLFDPFSQFRRLTQQMDRWFDTVGFARPGSLRLGREESPWGLGFWTPEMETFMRGDQFVVTLDLPGLDRDDLNVEVNDDRIVIHGERQNEHEEEREGYYRTERSYGRFYREVPLPEGAQADTARATFRDGVLEITVKAPEREAARPRRIEIGGTTEREERGGRADRGDRAVAAERSTQKGGGA